MSANNEPRVFVVDDDPAVRHSTALVLGAHGIATAEFETADAFLDQFDPAQPGCILLDLRMPGMTGEELLKTLRAGGVQIPVIVVTGHGDVPAAVRTMKLGLVDFLQKPVDQTILTGAVRAALAQDEKRRAEEAAVQGVNERLARLTPRERELLGLLAKGQTSKEIAGALKVSVKTVDNHRAHLLSKLEASNVAELAAIAVRAGLG